VTREPVRAVVWRRELVEELRERCAVIAASPWATAPLSAWHSPERPSAQTRAVVPLAPRPEPPRARRPHSAADPREVNRRLSREQADVVRDGMSMMAPSTAPKVRASRRRRRRKGTAGVVTRYVCPLCGGPHSRAQHDQARQAA
jgi:hypothetical protein